MLTKHIKIKQLNTVSKKSTSNNDLLLVETPLSYDINNTKFTQMCIPQFTEFLAQGLCYKHHNSLQKIQLSTLNPNHFQVTFHDDCHTIESLSMNELAIQPTDVIHWVRLFKDSQPLYRQTGATETVGVLTGKGHIFSIECISFETAYLKLVGALIKKDLPFFPVLFVSHRISLSQAKTIQMLPIAMIVCQSAITDQALDQFIACKQTVYGFCRKSKFNRYSNFHL